MRARLLEGIGVVIAYTAVGVFATWPLARDPRGGFYGFGNDNWGGMPYLAWLHDAYLGSESTFSTQDLQAPFGLDIPLHAIQPVDHVFVFLFGGFDGGLGAYNAQIFLSFVLAGCTMYLLARYVTGSPLAALVAGFAYTFSPFHLAFAMQYNALASIQWIPLYLLALLVLLRTGRLLHAGLAGAAFALVAIGSYYYAWFVAWFTVVALAVVAIAVAIRRRKVEWRRALRMTVSRGAVGAGVAIVIVAPLILTSARAARAADPSTIEHPISEAVRYSARPWMLFVPPHDNPIVGDRVRDWVFPRLHDAPVYEQSLYIGYALLALVALAFVPLSRSARVPDRLARGFFAAGVFTAALIMMGPYLPLDLDYWKLWQTPGETAHLPSLGWLMFQISGVFRFFSRSYVLFSACLVVLGAIGFARLEWRLGPSLLRRGALAAVVIAIMALEYTNAPPHVWFSDRAPAWVGAVKKLPRDSTIAHYPASAAFSTRSLYYMFWQTKHRRSITQPMVDPEALALAAATAAPDDPATARALRDAGIDYIVVHTQLPPETTPPYQPQLPPDALPADTGAFNPWLAVQARTPDAVIYRVLDAPRPGPGRVVVRPGAGFGAAEPEGSATARWLEAPRGDLDLFVAGPRRPLSLRLDLTSFNQPRRVSVGIDGRPVAAFFVSAVGYKSFVVPLGIVSEGRHTVTLVPVPGPQSIAETTGSPDLRSVSIRLRDPVRVVTIGK